MRCGKNMLRLLAGVAVFSLCISTGILAFGASVADNISPMDSQKLLDYVAAEGKDKVVVVNVFASWCPPCQKEVPDLIEIRKKYPQDKMLLIGVSMDEKMDALRKFIDKHSINYPVFLASGDFVPAFGVSYIPQLLVFDKSGELVINYTGLAEKKELVETIDAFLKKK